MKSRTSIVVIAALMLLFLSITVNAASCDQASCGFGLYCINGSCKKNLFLNPAVIVMGITAALIAFAFAIGKALEHPRIIHWAETELWEIIGTMVILALYLGASGFLDDVLGPAFYQSSLLYPGESKCVSTGSGGTWNSVRAHVESYISGLIGYVKDVIRDLGELGAVAGMASSMSLNLAIAPQMFWLPLFPEFGSVQQLLSTILYIITSHAVQLNVQLAVVQMWDNMFTILLPLGVLFRAFPLTRSAGSALIAIAVGFTILLPLSYLLIEDLSSHYWCTHCSGQSSTFASITPGLGLGSNIAGKVQDMLNNALTPNGQFQCIAFKMGIESLLLPMVAYLIVLNIIKHLAEILGAHVDLGTLVRVV